MSELQPPLAITFDFWDTLVQAGSVAATRSARRARVHSIVVGETGALVSEDELDRVLVDVRRAFDQKWKNNEQFTGPEATELMLERLGLDPDPAGRERIANGFMGVDDESLPALTDNIEATLRTLKEHDVRIGIICDVGLSPSFVLRSHLERHGVLELFDHWSFSDEVGVYKPDRRIFDHALTGLGGIPANRAAHVGDLRRTDVAGARAFGMTAVRYAGANDDAARDEGRAWAMGPGNFATKPPPKPITSSMTTPISPACSGSVRTPDGAYTHGFHVCTRRDFLAPRREIWE